MIVFVTQLIKHLAKYKSLWYRICEKVKKHGEHFDTIQSLETIKIAWVVFLLDKNWDCVHLVSDP